MWKFLIILFLVTASDRVKNIVTHDCPDFFTVGTDCYITKEDAATIVGTLCLQ